MDVPEFIYGCIAPTFTVFSEDGSIDADGQSNLIEYMLETGSVNTFFLRSGMGQMYVFDVEDTKALCRTACRVLKGRAPMLMGCSGVWDRNYDSRPDPDEYKAQVLELSRFAQDEGADGVVLTIPEGLVPGDGESMSDFLVRYFTMVCEAVSIPVLIYQPPGTRKEYCVTPESIARLAEIDNLAGMKVSTSDAYYIFNLVRAVEKKDFGFIVGAETAFYAGLLVGARACIGQGTSVNPVVIKAILDRYLAGDYDGVIEAQEDTNRLVEECPNAVDFLKMYATEKGFPVGTAMRSMKGNPYMEDRVPITPEGYAAYKALFEETVAKYS